ncbi:MAG TPA: DegT/DnrJ/EryC1/StrS family aminotransferase [Rhizobiales bacterium]|nr:DegT/DnrJ/EryC1/StrS family aminotransferase [Hyphomicrobiales bacterium]
MSAAVQESAAARRIPLVDLNAQYERYRAELDDALRRVVNMSSFIGGAEHDGFAADFAAWCGGGHVALVGNGTDALTLSINELLGPGDGTGDIVTASHTFIATAEAIVNAGFRPVFADIEPQSCLVSPEAMEGAITPSTRALMPVHLYGQLADMKAVRKIADRHGLAVIEDAAQAHGASFDGVRPGELSEAACFSFYPGKNLGAWGDGGAVFTKDAALADRIRRRANHGRSDKYRHETQGTNSRLDTLQASVLRVKLRHLSEWNEERRRAAGWYDELLGNQPAISLPFTDSAATHVFHLYVVQLDDRDRVRERLNVAGIGAGIHYPIPVHEQPAFAGLGYSPDDLPLSSRAAKRVLSLPLYPEISREQVARVADSLIEAVRA